MWWTKKKPKILKEIKYNTLTVKNKDGSVFSWTCDLWQGGSHIEPWKHFYKWFFGRSSDFFIMRYKNGETAFRRDNINSFEVVVKTELIESV